MYVTTVPILPVVFVAGLLLQYWADKYAILCVAPRPRDTHGKVARCALRLLPSALLLHLVSGVVAVPVRARARAQPGLAAAALTRRS